MCLMEHRDDLKLKMKQASDRFNVVQICMK